MGLETEKADVQLFMDDDSYSRHSGVDYADPQKFADAGGDRDPNQLNAHLKVESRVGWNLGLRLVQAPATAWGCGCPSTPNPTLATGSARGVRTRNPRATGRLRSLEFLAKFLCASRDPKRR